MREEDVGDLASARSAGANFVGAPRRQRRGHRGFSLISPPAPPRRKSRTWRETPSGSPLAYQLPGHLGKYGAMAGHRERGRTRLIHAQGLGGPRGASVTAAGTEGRREL